MLHIPVRIIMMCIVWAAAYIPKREKTESFCAGFCVAEAITGLCGRCSWMYSVVFGEYLGFVMLTVTVAGAMVLFGFLSEKGGTLLSAIYIFFSSAELEYVSAEVPIINTAAKGIRLGCVGAGGKSWGGMAAMLVSAVSGSLLTFCGTKIPVAFSAISCCALLTKGIKNISCGKWCCVGSAAAVVLAYL